MRKLGAVTQMRILLPYALRLLKNSIFDSIRQKRILFKTLFEISLTENLLHLLFQQSP